MMLVDINDNFQLMSGHDPGNAGLGWKMFSSYWKYLRDETEFLGAIKQVAPERAESVRVADRRHAVSHTCSACGLEAVGMESIERIFGIVGPPKVLCRESKI